MVRKLLIALAAGLLSMSVFAATQEGPTTQTEDSFAIADNSQTQSATSSTEQQATDTAKETSKKTHHKKHAKHNKKSMKETKENAATDANAPNTTPGANGTMTEKPQQ